MGPKELDVIRTTFKISQRELAKALNVAPYTVARWETGNNVPTGLQEEVLRALYLTAVKIKTDNRDDAAAAISGKITLGVGALIFYCLTYDLPTRPSPRARR